MEEHNYIPKPSQTITRKPSLILLSLSIFGMIIVSSSIFLYHLETSQKNNHVLFLQFALLSITQAWGVYFCITSVIIALRKGIRNENIIKISALFLPFILGIMLFYIGEIQKVKILSLIFGVGILVLIAIKKFIPMPELEKE